MTDGEGQPDWAATLEGLGSVERLEQVTKIPAALQAVVSTEGSLDREALSAAAAGLAQQVVSLRQQLEVVGRDYDLPDVQDDSSPHIRCTARDLAAWADTQVVALAREAATVNRL